MSKYTTFKTGGCADILLSPSSIDEIKNIIDICNKNKLDCIVIGNGSNLLVGDKGIRGVVIRLGREFAGINIEETQIRVQAGALLSAVANTALKESLCGMEFAASIPGTIGGAVCMNAGAYGGEMKDIIREVTVLYNGEVVTLSNEQSGFEYRNSTIMQKGMIVLETVIDLSKGSCDDIKAVMDDYSQRRRSKQPLDKPSAGSTFKRPEGHFAGKLIEDAGLKGFGIGGAQVSEKHCGFVVNTGGATSADILRLIDAVKARVYEASGVMLEPEVRMIGEF
jgi:UDP-N-acetylmuramate dehydrogenase